MLCSTIIPTVNRPSLERAVKSALDQDLDLDLYEIIVVNDSGTPLPEGDWLESPNIQVVNTNRVERCVARNVGAALASGKYLHFLDDDDYLVSGGLKALLSVGETSNCYWIHGMLNRVDDEDEFISINRADIEGNIFAFVVAGEVIHLGQSLIMRDKFLQVGGFDPLLKTVEDRDLECRMALISDFGHTDRVIVNVRVGVGGISTTDWSRLRQNSRVVREKALNSQGALARMIDSIGNHVILRGRCCRAYLISAILNLSAGRFFIACSRLLPLIRLASFYPVLPDFWRGLFNRSYLDRHSSTEL